MICYLFELDAWINLTYYAFKYISSVNWTLLHSITGYILTENVYW